MYVCMSVCGCGCDCVDESGCVGVAALIDSITVSVCGWEWV